MPQVPRNISEGVRQRYAIQRNTFRVEKVENPKRLHVVEVGDSKQDVFYPQLKLTGWDNDANFSLRLVDNNAGSVSTDDKKILYRNGSTTTRFYEIDDSDFEDGAFEFDLVLTERPVTNVIEFTVRAKNLKAYFQPELTQDEIDQGAHRPERYIRSWAIYHTSKRNNRVGGNEYRTGKFGHIPRPYFTDADGNKVWCDFELPIDEENNIIDGGVARLTLADEYKTAPLPIVVDPTFGYTTAGSSWQRAHRTQDANEVTNYGITTSSFAGTLDSLHAYVRDGNGSTGSKTYQWDISNASNAEANIAALSETETSHATGAWFVGTAASQALSAETIWMGFEAPCEGSFCSESDEIAYDSGSGLDGTRFLAAQPGTPWLDDTSRNYSFYATYTAAGADYTLTAESGSFTLTGTDATLLHNRTISAESGSFNLTGADATLTYNSNSNACYLLQENGDLLLQENGDGLLLETCSLGINAESGSFTLTGTDAQLLHNRVLYAESGSFTLTGADAVLTYNPNNLSIECEPGVYTLTGSDVSLCYSGSPWTDIPRQSSSWTDATRASSSWTDTPRSSGCR